MEKHSINSWVYHALLIGMTASTVLFAVGVAVELAHGAHLVGFNAELLMKLGTIAMILTPVSRVAVSIIAFAEERDYRFVVITALVLAAVAASVLLGLSGLRMRG